MQDSTCEKCGIEIQIWKRADTIRCKNCGALYDIISSELQDQHIDYVFNFIEFRCINVAALKDCDNACPAPGMYCKEHVSDTSFTSVRSSISYATQRLADAKEILERMEESKKTWLIQEVSGIDEQDSSVREDSDGEN